MALMGLEDFVQSIVNVVLMLKNVKNIRQNRNWLHADLVQNQNQMVGNALNAE
jgi:hypothetical protein